MVHFQVMGKLISKAWSSASNSAEENLLFDLPFRAEMDVCQGSKGKGFSLSPAHALGA